MECWSTGVRGKCITPLLHHSSLHQAGVVCDGLNVLNDLNALNGLGNQEPVFRGVGPRYLPGFSRLSFHGSVFSELRALFSPVKLRV